MCQHLRGLQIFPPDTFYLSGDNCELLPHLVFSPFTDAGADRQHPTRPRLYLDVDRTAV